MKEKTRAASICDRMEREHAADAMSRGECPEWFAFWLDTFDGVSKEFVNKEE